MSYLQRFRRFKDDLYGRVDYDILVKLHTLGIPALTHRTDSLINEYRWRMRLVKKILIKRNNL